MRTTSCFADATLAAAPTDQTTKRIGDQSALGAPRSTTVNVRESTPAANVNKRQQKHHASNKYSGASR